MKNKRLLVLIFVMLVVFVFPKVVYADTIHLTGSDFEEAFEKRGYTIPEHEGMILVPESEEPGEWEPDSCTEDGKLEETEPGSGEYTCTAGEFVPAHQGVNIIPAHEEEGLIPEETVPPVTVKGITAYEEYDEGNGKYIIRFGMSSNTYILDEDINMIIDDDYIFMLVMDGVDIEFDLNGHTLTAGRFNYGTIDVINSTLHIYGNGAILGDELGINAQDSDIVIDNGHFSDFTCNDCDVLIKDGSFINIYSKSYYNGNSNVVINNGNFFSLYHGLLLSDQNVNLTINHGNFYGVYTGLEVLNNTNIDIHDGNFYGLVFGALISSQASTFKLEKASFNVNPDVFMEEFYSKFDFMFDDSFTQEDFVDLLERFGFTNLEKVGAVGVIIGNNDGLELEEFLADNFVFSRQPTFETEEMTYRGEQYNEIEDTIRYISDDDFSILANYLIIEGANQTYQYKPITMRANGSYDLFEKLLVNGVEVPRDSYTTASGSTIVTLSNDYLSTLPAGVHDITLVYINGEARTGLTVLGSNPQTYDSITIYMVLSILSLVILGFFIKKRY